MCIFSVCMHMCICERAYACFCMHMFCVVCKHLSAPPLCYFVKGLKQDVEFWGKMLHVLFWYLFGYAHEFQGGFKRGCLQSFYHFGNNPLFSASNSAGTHIGAWKSTCSITHFEGQVSLINYPSYVCLSVLFKTVCECTFKCCVYAHVLVLMHAKYVFEGNFQTYVTCWLIHCTCFFQLLSIQLAFVNSYILRAQVVAKPADLIKVRMQADGRLLSQGLQPRYSGIFNAFKKIIQTEGFLGLWRGVLPNAQRAFLVNMGELTCYDQAKHFIINNQICGDNTFAHTLASVASGLSAQLMWSRLEWWTKLWAKGNLGLFTGVLMIVWWRLLSLKVYLHCGRASFLQGQG